MALYLYYCSNCGTGVEVRQPMHQERPKTVKCPCGEQAERVVTCPAIVFDWKHIGKEGVVVGPDRFRGSAVPQRIGG